MPAPHARSVQKEQACHALILAENRNLTFNAFYLSQSAIIAARRIMVASVIETVPLPSKSAARI